MGRTLSTQLKNLLPLQTYDKALLVEIETLPQTPPIAPSATNAGAGNIAAGTYNWIQTFTDASNIEGAASPASANLTAGSAFQASVKINKGPTGVTKRNLYRSSAGGAAPYKLVTTVNDNTTTTVTDNVASGSLGATQVDPVLRFTDYKTAVTQTIDGKSRTFAAASVTVSGIGQSMTTGMDNASITLWNVDNTWSAFFLKQGARNRYVRIWEGYFDATTHAWVDYVELFTGRADELKLDEDSADVTLLPHAAPWSVRTPGCRFTSTCPNRFRGPRCRYGIPFGATSYDGPTLEVGTAGSGLANGTYYWAITALDGSGETLPSFSNSIAVTGGPRYVNVSWTAFPGAPVVSYNIYRGSAAGLEQLVGNSASTTFTDTGTTPTSQRPPKVNTAGAGTDCGRTYDKDCVGYGNTIHFRGHRTLVALSEKIFWNGDFTQLPTRS